MVDSATWQCEIHHRSVTVYRFGLRKELRECAGIISESQLRHNEDASAANMSPELHSSRNYFSCNSCWPAKLPDSM